MPGPTQHHTPPSGGSNPPSMPPAVPVQHNVHGNFEVSHFNPYNYNFQRRFSNYTVYGGSVIYLYPFYDSNGNLYWVTYINGQPYLVTNSNIIQYTTPISPIVTSPTYITNIPPGTPSLAEQLAKGTNNNTSTTTTSSDGTVPSPMMSVSNTPIEYNQAAINAATTSTTTQPSSTTTTNNSTTTAQPNLATVIQENIAMLQRHNSMLMLGLLGVVILIIVLVTTRSA